MKVSFFISLLFFPLMIHTNAYQKARKDRELATPLFVAVCNGQDIKPSLAKIMTTKRYKALTVQEINGLNPLHYSLYKGHGDATSLLLAAFAQHKPEELGKVDVLGNNALHLCVQDVALTKYVIQCIEDTQQIGALSAINVEGYNPLGLAQRFECHASAAAIQQALVKHGLQDTTKMD